MSDLIFLTEILNNSGLVGAVVLLAYFYNKQQTLLAEIQKSIAKIEENNELSLRLLERSLP